eukprot:Skav236657  [mRNA]  locus=scaffold3354:22483:25147:+ [translate_table: standard]
MDPSLVEEVNKAFEVLTDPKKRQAYDLRGAELRMARCQEYFVGFMLETLPDVSYEAISNAYEQAGWHVTVKKGTQVFPSKVQNDRGPVASSCFQAILVERCTEKRAKDVVDALMELLGSSREFIDVSH